MDAGDLTCEQRRRQNIADNKRILAEIGLINPFRNLPKVQLKKTGLKRKAEDEIPRRAKKPLLEDNIDHSKYGSVVTSRRRSARIQGNTSLEGSEFLDMDDDVEDEENKIRRVPPNRPNHYGDIEGVEVGASWLTRMECCRDGIHRPPVSGIHAGQDGAFSIALSGGYDDNVDLGECFTYTGEGGRDLKGTKTNPKNLRMAPQSKDQTLTRGNLALSRNVDTGNPVRVIRGYKLTSPFAPEEGYRYDGLYTVEKAWYACGASGFMVWKFALRRCDGQEAPSWNFCEDIEGARSPNKTDDKPRESPAKQDKKEELSNKTEEQSDNTEQSDEKDEQSEKTEELSDKTEEQLDNTEQSDEQSEKTEELPDQKVEISEDNKKPDGEMISKLSEKVKDSSEHKTEDKTDLEDKREVSEEVREPTTEKKEAEDNYSEEVKESADPKKEVKEPEETIEDEAEVNDKDSKQEKEDENSKKETA